MVRRATKITLWNLPAQECFFNDLTDEGISSENYQFCQTIWDEFEMCKFEDYHLLYNLIDVLILTDILIYFRQLIRQDYNLDCFKFFSMPGLAFKSALKRSGIQIQLLTDMDQHLFGNFFHSTFSFNFFQNGKLFSLHLRFPCIRVRFYTIITFFSQWKNRSEVALSNVLKNTRYNRKIRVHPVPYFF